MKSPVRALVWVIALFALVAATYAVVTRLNRAPAGAEQSAGAISSAQAADTKPQTPADPAAAPNADREFGVLPPYQTRRVSPGEQFYRAGRYEEAVQYWTEMAKQGDIESNYRLGREYLYATSGAVQRDAVKAREYFLASAKLGDAASMFEIGSIYDNGLGVTVDVPQAGVWFKRSADYGHPQGQYNYATMLEDGQGAPKDDIMAYVYYRLAAAQGFYGVPYNVEEKRADKSAKVPLELLEARLTPEQVKDGDAKFAAFKVKTGPLEI